MVATSGGLLLPNEAIRTVTGLLVPIATVLTPNIPEAKLLATLVEGDEPVDEISSVEDLEKMAARIQTLGPKWVLLKGGHLPLTKDLAVAEAGVEGREPAVVVDILYGEGRAVRIQSPYQISDNTHGTGCTLACKCCIGSRSSPMSNMWQSVLTGPSFIQPQSHPTFPGGWTFPAPCSPAAGTSSPPSPRPLGLARATAR
ncbi:bifunctional hydroxymethylpyrimidine kinase/phosphomethylpyrimidine kinase [Candidatus Bathyarchaeota archaeon]|nr:bifunctional hydroxymethylpyrimidine kinase/phosphomethylpyrimidine kinase [Candidatus Bathyarchaeota archaeon]